MNIITRFKRRTKTAFTTGSTQGKQPEDAKEGLWYHVKYWSHQRPFWGAFCVLLASLLILWAPLRLLQSGIVPASTQWTGLLVGGLLFVMGLIELFAPSHALVAGAIGIVLSLISLITALGGLGTGMLLGVIGSSYAVAWKPEKKIGSRPVFWLVLGSSITTLSGMMILVTNGMLAVAAPVAGPYTSVTSKVKCLNTHAVPAISQVDHRTPVILSHSASCTSSNIVITQHVLGRTITITQATATATGVTSETVASHTGLSQSSNGTLTTANGLTQNVAVSITTNVTSQVLFSNAVSSTVSNISVKIS